MNKNWRWFIPGYLWASLNTLLNLLWALLLYRPHSWQWREGVLTCIAGTKNGRSRIWGQPGGQGFGGWLVVYKNEFNRDRADLRVHENCHVVQGMVLGPAFLILYPLFFSALWCYVAVAEGETGWRKAYRLNPFKEQAYRRQAGYVLTVKTGTDWAESRWGHVR